jgi:hypothetical protein
MKREKNDQGIVAGTGLRFVSLESTVPLLMRR